MNDDEFYPFEEDEEEPLDPMGQTVDPRAAAAIEAEELATSGQFAGRPIDTINAAREVLRQRSANAAELLGSVSKGSALMGGGWSPTSGISLKEYQDAVRQKEISEKFIKDIDNVIANKQSFEDVAEREERKKFNTSIEQSVDDPLSGMSSYEAMPNIPERPLPNMSSYNKALEELQQQQQTRIEKLGGKGKKLKEAYDKGFEAYNNAIKTLNNFKIDPDSVANSMGRTQTIMMGIAMGLERAGNFISKNPNGPTMVADLLAREQKKDLERQKFQYQQQIQQVARTEQDLDRAARQWDDLEKQLDQSQKAAMKLQLMDLATKHPGAQLDLAKTAAQIDAINTQNVFNQASMSTKAADIGPPPPDKILEKMSTRKNVLSEVGNLIKEAKELDKEAVAYPVQKYWPNSDAARYRKKLELFSVELRKAKESGVMTEQDFKRYSTLLDAKTITTSEIIKRLSDLERTQQKAYDSTLKVFSKKFPSLPYYLQDEQDKELPRQPLKVPSKKKTQK
jgi:hypothetical protein